MNLQPLFETQKILDQRIIKQHGLEGQDLLPQKILALQVELGECANEWRGFKFWSKDQEPRICTEKGALVWNPLLEEYVDCLHFILSIGLDEEFEGVCIEKKGKSYNIGFQFIWVFKELSDFGFCNSLENYKKVWETFLGLGEFLGFTWEQIEQAYYDKNKVNHSRQDTGY